MPTQYNSQEVASTVAVPPVKLSTQLNYGRVRTLWFKFLTGTDDGGAGFKNGDSFVGPFIPPGAKIKKGRVAFEAMGASATLSIGITGATTKYLSGLDVSAAGASEFADTIARNMGVQVAGPAGTIPATDPGGERLIITAGGADFADAKVILGYVEVIVD